MAVPAVTVTEGLGERQEGGRKEGVSWEETWEREPGGGKEEDEELG